MAVYKYRNGDLNVGGCRSHFQSNQLLLKLTPRDNAIDIDNFQCQCNFFVAVEEATQKTY